MADRPVVCKHGVKCSYVNNVFLGCEKCLKRGLLTGLTYLPRTKLDTLPNSQMENPFGKSSLLPRSPPRPPQSARADDNLSLTATESSLTAMASVEDKETIIDEILNTNIVPVLQAPTIDASVKSFMTKAQNMVKTLSSDKNELVNRINSLEAENAKKIQKLQEQINAISSANASSRSRDAHLQSGKELVKNNSRKPSGQSKLTQFATGKPVTPKPGASTTPVSNQFATLENDVESNHDADDSESSDTWVDYNSDPEFNSKRKAIQSQRRKRKRASTSASSVHTDDQQTKPGESAPVKVNIPNPSVSNASSVKKILPTPPIKVIGVDNYVNLVEIITKKSVKKEDVRTKIINNEVWQLNPKDDATAKIILESLRETHETNNKVQYYTHCNKNLRDIKVIVRGLHPSIEEQDILDDLKNKGFKPKKATCLMKRVPLSDAELKALKKSVSPVDSAPQTPDPKSVPEQNSVSAMETNSTVNETTSGETYPSETIVDKDNVPLFIADSAYVSKTKLIKIPVHQVDFDYTDDIEKIYKIVGICSMVVKVEPIKVSTTKIIQCRKCQNFGHSQAYCGKQARCVKCAAKHLSTECPWAKRIINPKCANCGVTGHPASYRGCPFAKAMQKDREKSIKMRKGKIDGSNFPNFPDKPNKKKKGGKNPPSAIKQGVSFADAVSGPKPSNQQEELISQLLMTIESLRKQLEEMSKRQEKYEQALMSRVLSSR